MASFVISNVADEQYVAEQIRRAVLSEAEHIRLANEQKQAAWNAMAKQQKILTVVNQMFSNWRYIAFSDIPDNFYEQALIRNIFQELMNDGTINIALINLPDARPTDFTVLSPFINRHVTKAVNIYKYESAPYNMTRQEAKDFDDFHDYYIINFRKFYLNIDQTLLFYRALKENFDGMSWADVMKNLTPILKNGLPLDYNEWPNFKTNPGAEFNNFIRNIVTPTINATRGQADIEAAAENYIQDLLIRIEQNLKANIVRKFFNYSGLYYDYESRELINHGHKIPLNNVPNIN